MGARSWFDRKQATAATPRPSPDGENGGRDVLLYSRDSELTEELSDLLAERGHRCTSHRNLWPARTAARRRRPDLVVIDWRVGEQSAAKLLTALHKTDENHHHSTLALVPADHPENLRKILELGITDFLTLPLDRNQLTTRLSLLETRLREIDVMLTFQDDLKRDYARFLIATGGLEDGVWDWDLVEGTVHYSDRWKANLGFSPEEIGDAPEEWLGRVHPEDISRLRAIIDASIAGEIGIIEQRYRMLGKDDREVWILTRGEVVTDAEGKPVRMVGRQTDVSEEDGSGESLRTARLQDPLTRLPNRTVLMDRLRHAFDRARRDSEQGFAVLFFDLDRFKNVNDSLGHLTGDKLLRAIARRVQKACRPGDIVARFGGDEFVIVVEDIANVRGATAAAERIQDEFRVPFDLDGNEVFASISIGIALWNESYERPEDLLRDSDTAMYRAKALGRNSFAVFDDAMHRKVVATLRLENDLRRALAREEFRVYYQPILTISDGRITGFEALVRWIHPERGLLLPGEFISVAEEMGAIIQLDRWVAEEACRQLQAWQRKFRSHAPLTMSVNLSTTHFLRPDVVPIIDLILRNSGLYGQSLKLEVTESVLMENAKYATAMLEQLRALNIGISIDDFGTGYSSLAYLRRFEIDTLKIDYSFVSRMLVDEESSEIVRTITTLAKNLGKDTVAEGVETRSQLEALRDLEVDMVQGYFIAPPAPADAAERLLERTEGASNHLEKILSDRLRGTAMETATENDVVAGLEPIDRDSGSPDN
ncbi:MAG: EAL domain-containing protein [Thermoanaerobaculales bacterium]